MILFCLQPCWTLWSLGSRELALKSFWRIFLWSENYPAAVPVEDFLGWEGRTSFDWAVWGSCWLWCVNKAEPGNFGAKHSPVCVHIMCGCTHSFCSTHESPVNCVWVTESLWCVQPCTALAVSGAGISAWLFCRFPCSFNDQMPLKFCCFSLINISLSSQTPSPGSLISSKHSHLLSSIQLSHSYCNVSWNHRF